MPLFEYECVACGERVEQIRPNGLQDTMAGFHKDCRYEPRLRRILTPPHLHGSPNMPNG